jgi:hypothetical protein
VAPFQGSTVDGAGWSEVRGKEVNDDAWVLHPAARQEANLDFCGP